jgi:hypothetical protein
MKKIEDIAQDEIVIYDIETDSVYALMSSENGKLSTRIEQRTTVDLDYGTQYTI